MKAVAKTMPALGIEFIEAEEPKAGPGQVKIQVEKGSICGTDLHIYEWSPWASERMHLPRIIGHEFCGEIVEVGEGVSKDRIGEFVSSESHITCGKCIQCLSGQAHVCANVKLIGVDVDGGFRAYTVIPSQNARKTSLTIPKSIACMQDAIGNAVHTVMSVPITNNTILITGLGPIGLFAAAICKILGAKKIYATEVSPFRIKLGKQLGIDEIFNPHTANVGDTLKQFEKYGVDISLEMSGHSSSLKLAVNSTRSGGEVSLLGIFPTLVQDIDVNAIILKGLTLHGITGRRLWQTWDQMDWLFTKKGLDISPIITHEMPLTHIKEAMEILKAGDAGKIVLDFSRA